MIKEMVEKTMRKALVNLSEKSKANIEDIALFIHSKNEQLTPKYFYTIKGVPAQENGAIIDLDFTKDILGKRLDIMGTEKIASDFLSKYFNNASKEFKINPNSMYIGIFPKDEKAKELLNVIYNGSEAIKEIDLESIFGE